MIRLPNYTLVELVHESPGAVFYRGFRDDDRAQVTVKLLAGDPGPRATERLRNEYAILQSAAAPSVVRPIALEAHEGGLALVLEGLSGAPLDALARAQRLDLQAALEIGGELARALAAVHGAGVVHGDLRPANVMVDLEAGVVKLFDFGIARRIPAGGGPPSARHGGLLEGGLVYISPEQTGRTGRGVDHRSDLYSLGVTLYELLTGAPPFASEDPVELAHAHLALSPAPPADLAPGIPRAASDLVMKLLEKAPEARYQSAAGLLADLERCLSGLSRGGEIAPFPLGSRDAPAELSPPEGLYGRDAEAAALHEAFERAAGGGKELLLVEGPSGIGKTALVRELGPAVVARRGRFVSGKCDQKGRSAPYAPVIDALRELCARLLTGGEAALSRLRDELVESLEPNGQVLVDLVPELGLVIGAQDPAPELGPAEAQNRLAGALGAAFRVLARPGHPLVLFLDDLQWADPGTAWLLRVLLTDDAVQSLLIVGALRDDALPEGHPLPPALAALRERGAAVTTIRLDPLGADDLRRFIADALGARRDQVGEIAEILLASTGGNPFFSYRLLRALHEGSAIALDAEQGVFEVDREKLAAIGHGGGVVELLRGELERLPPATRRILVLAAGIGHAFDRETLAQLSGRTEAEIDAALSPALREVYILPAGRGERAAGRAPAEGAYRFAHDRLQQAASLLVDESARRRNALAIGRLLLARAEESGRDEDLFDAADHLNEGAPLVEDPGERAALARTGLRAGHRARARAAFAAAARHFQAGVSLLDGESFERDHDLAFALHAELAACEVAKGEADAALGRLELLDGRARAAIERTQVATLRIELWSLLGKFPEAVRAGAAALRPFGIELPETEEARQAALRGVLARAAVDLTARPASSWLLAGEMTDPGALALERLLFALCVPAYLVDPALLGVVTRAWIELVTERGHSDLSAIGYTQYGFFLSFFPERQRDAYEIGKLALALDAQRGSRALSCGVIETFAGNIAFLHEPLRSVLARFPAALRAGMESGDFVHVAFICDHMLLMRIGIGDPLDAIAAQIDELIPLIERTNNVFSTTIGRMVRQVVRSLAGKAEDLRAMSDRAAEERALAAIVAGEGFGNLAALHRTLRLMVLVVQGDWDEALAAAYAAEEKSAYAAGQFFSTELTFFAALARIRGGGERESESPALAGHVERLRAWAGLCPATYRHKHLLVLAELARLEGDELAAMKRYDQAIDLARGNELLRDEALASELASGFHREQGRARIARAYATDAYRRYLAWGATGKARAMQRGEAGTSLPPPSQARPSLAPAFTSSAALEDGVAEEVSALLDVSAVIRAAQAIAGEIVPERVIEQLLRIVASSAGAERGYLVLERDGAWRVAARVGPDGIETSLDVPLGEATFLAGSVVRHVARAREPVLLADAARDRHFALDPYVARCRPRSILCMEMTQKGHRVGVVYLENNAVRGAFGKDRIVPLGILLSQAAIAIEIGRLYDRVEAASEDLARANARLEGEVALQTAQLRRELTVRTEAERERTALTEQILLAQEERIVELSAPLLPIADDVVLMPLIGGLDAARAARILEAATGGASRWRARVVILDITGVTSADAEVAAGLLRAAQALRLLGAEAVITGVRAEVAGALVELGADLGGLVTKGTLKAGIAYAMRRRR